MKPIRNSASVYLVLPFVDVVTEVGIAAAFPQLRDVFGSNLRASLVVAISPFFAVLMGWVWGVLARGKALTLVSIAATVGWGGGTAALGLVFERFWAVLLFRGLQGVFSAGMAALPFIHAAGQARGRRDRSTAFGSVEAAVSVGAIIAPISLGTLVTIAPRVTLTSLGLCVTVGAVTWGGLARLRYPHQLRYSREIGAAASRQVLRNMVTPTIFAAGIALVLGALETLIPVLAERLLTEVSLGKAVTMAFEILVVIGIFATARRPAILARVPLALAGCITVAFVWATHAWFVVTLLVACGLPIGAGITIGNEFAAERARGTESIGMAVYATLRIVGSFLGPLLMNIRYPVILAALGTVALGCSALLMARRPLGAVGEK